MARLRTSSQVVAAALNVRLEGLRGQRHRTLSHSTLLNWERRLAANTALHLFQDVWVAALKFG